MNFNEFIRSKGLTQAKLAEAMNCSRANISLWATGEVFPMPDSINNMIAGFASLGIVVTYDEIYRSLLVTKREKRNEVSA
jgi:transcriptional regulator with XRE-family HTH domain